MFHLNQKTLQRTRPIAIATKNVAIGPFGL